MSKRHLSSIARRRRERLLVPEQLEHRWLLAGDLTAHWLADNLTTDLEHGSVIPTWADSISGLEVSANGSPTLATDQLGGRAVINFQGSDGADTFFLDSRLNPLTGADDFSVVVAFRTDATDLVGANSQWFQNTGIVDANQMGFGHDWGLSVNASGQLSTGMGAGFGTAPTTVYSTATGLNDGGLHTAVVTRSGGTLSLAIDDLPIDRREDGPASPRSRLDLTIGALTDGNLPFNGDIAEIRIYDGALSELESDGVRAEIESYYGNAPPQANDDSYTLSEDAGLFAVNANNGVLANDSDADNDQLTATITQPPTVGTVSLTASGAFVYTAPQNFFGQVSFSYTANDHRSSEPATVTLDVLPTYDAPVLAADSYKMRPGGTLNIPALVGVLSNDDNVDNAELMVSEARAVNSGELSLSSDGSFSYTPNGFEGVATFAYQVDDGTQTTGPAEVIIAVNTPPVANEDIYSVLEDDLLDVGPANGLLANDQDAQAANELTAILISSTTNGTLDLSPDGSFTYLPNHEFSGSDSFTYRISDGFDNSQVATVTITVETVNDIPESTVDAYFTLPGQTLAIPTDTGVLANDTDVEGAPLTARAMTSPSRGTVTVQPDGSFVYIPNVGFQGRDSFAYVASDGVNDSAATDVFIEVASQPLIISEFQAINSQTLPTRLRDSAESRFRGDDQFFDWIELRNLLDVDLNLSGVHLTDSADDPLRWAFPAGTIVPAGQFLLVFASGLDTVDTELDEQGLLHTSFRLGSQGEYLALTAQDGAIIDEFGSPPRQFPNTSYGRLNNQMSYFATVTPGEANQDPRSGRADEVTVSPGHGFYNEAIQVTLSADNNPTSILYTLDGSEPTATNGIVYSSPITIDKTSTLRAVALYDTVLSGTIATNTYVFLDDVVTQSPDGSAPTGWPERPVRGQAFDYGMDPEIVDDPVWGPQLKDALTQIPTISVVLNQENLTGSAAGIYVNASRDGSAWERPASVELVYPDGTEGFQIDAGLRIRGGFSRGAFNPKHSFRLFFRDDYEGVLNYPLFEDEGTDEFRAVDLRTAQNYAWSNDTFNDQTRNSFLRDIYSRDLQRELGQPYTRGRYYHLYLNGQYWGLYQTEERPEASFAETYLGGNADDYDVIKASGGVLEATDGELQPWQDLWAIANRGFDSLDDYFLIQGKNPDGTDNPDLEVHVQIDNVIDFAVNYMFTGNQDMPTSLGNAGANNFWAIRNPANRDGWHFVAHDNEHNMLAVNDDQTRDDPAGNAVTSFNPKYLHQQLDALPEYRLRFADRLHKHFFNDGAVTREKAVALMQTRVEQIDQAIIAESARWGDQHNEPALDKNTWLAEVDWLLNDFLGTRTQTVLDQFRNRGLYPDVAAPELNQHGGLVDSGFALEISTPAGTIYYTLDGQDPREIGGTISPQALTWTENEAVILSSDAQVMARVWNGTEWSALTETQFLVGEAIAPTSLRISEIHYHPQSPSESEQAAGFTNDDNFEFIELVNTSDQPVDLTLAGLTRTEQNGESVGVDFDFAEGSISRLGPGERVVIVEDMAAFKFRYGTDIPIAGQWSGGLSNAGEQLTLLVNGQVLQQFSYDDAWHTSTDGTGPSLEIVNAADPILDNWAVAASWRASNVDGGSPGRSSRLVGDSNGDGIFDSADLVAVFQAAKYEDGIPNNATFEEGDWNQDGDFNTSDFVFAFRSGTYQLEASKIASRLAAITEHLFAEVVDKDERRVLFI